MGLRLTLGRYRAKKLLADSMNGGPLTDYQTVQRQREELRKQLAKQKRDMLLDGLGFCSLFALAVILWALFGDKI